LGRCEAGAWQLLSSVIVEEEVNNTPSSERRSRVRNMLSGAYGMVALTDVAIARAQELKALGFRTYDALHLACAEQATVDIFLTTDDRVLRIATRHTGQLKVCVANLLDWFLEVIQP
jgi:predicted nucleic acid-binding protein